MWDAVLEYRVWLHPERGAPDLDEGNDYFEAFASYAQAAEFAARSEGAEEPIALVLQAGAVPASPCRTAQTIPRFLALDAPANRLAVLRGEDLDDGDGATG